MLHWLFGSMVADAGREEDDNDAPETPAPVFAARAFKSALFGTPAWGDEDELERSQHSTSMNGRVRTGSCAASGVPSLTKPQGILLTPGTAAFRRKTVSFGAGVIENEGKNPIGKSGVPHDCPGKFPSPFTPKIDETMQPARRTALISALEAARDGQAKKSTTGKSAPTIQVRTQSSLESVLLPGRTITSGLDTRTLDAEQLKECNSDKMSSAYSTTNEDLECDMTLDLNEPYSHSGRYWKSEYDRYHEEAKTEMTRLVKYKQLAKSYAKKKDSEAIDLGEKLKEEQQKVTEMEAKISELAAQIVNKRLNGVENETHDSMKDLARRTALAKEYKDRVSESQVSLQESQARWNQGKHESHNNNLARTTQTAIEASRPINACRDQVADTVSLRDEILRLRMSLSISEKRVSKLQDENTVLVKDLSRVSEELDKSDRRRQSAEARNNEQVLLMQTIQKEYDTMKDLAKSQRRDAEGLLKKRHEQVIRLKKEIKSLKEHATASIPDDTDRVATRSRMGNNDHMRREAGKIGKLEKFGYIEDLMSFDTPPKRECLISELLMDYERPYQSAYDTKGVVQPELSYATRYEDHTRTRTTDKRDTDLTGVGRIIDRFDEKSRIAVQKDVRKTDGVIPERDNMASRHMPLSEVINSAKTDRSPADHHGSSLQDRYSGLARNPLSFPPSPEPSFPMEHNRRITKKRSIDGPQPSMFNNTSSPPKQVFARSRPSCLDSIAHQKDDKLSSSRLSSTTSRARTALPSDRAAAAKARLEQKSAEKRKVREMHEEKENIPN